MNRVDCIWDARADLGEGVFWHALDQAVYWVDIYQSNLHRITADGERKTLHFAGLLSAAVPCNRGGLIATLQSGIHHLDTESGVATLIRELESDLTDNRFNDASSDQRGQFWFGSMDDNQLQASGSFYRMSATGECAKIESFGTCIISNGPAISCDDDTIYFTDTTAGKIYRAAINASGEPEAIALHIDFDDQPGHPDGMCCDTAGGLWICHFDGHRVTRFRPDGSPDFHIELPVPNITKCAFGGDDMQTLYMTTARVGMSDKAIESYPLAGGLFATRVDFSGTAMPAIDGW